jgi:hypothetical protein
MHADIRTREQFIALFASTQDAIAFEDSCLQVGREFLPAQAILVRAGAEPSPEYWQWLADELAQTRRGE